MVNLYIEGQLIDQYDDESVQIVSSVLDVQDITKNTGDYSKTFSVPTSKRNNKIFKHWYNATIDGGFDARTRVTGTIDIDGVPFKSGKWLLRSVKMVKGVADSYKINFFGETASLQQILGKDVLRGLDLSAFNHVYTAAKIKEGLELGLFSDSVIYTTMSQKGMFYDSHSGTHDLTNSNGDVLLRNIADAGGGTGIQYSELRPSLKVIEIINAIESKYNITFSRDFFSTTEFDNLYIWLAPDLEGKAIGNNAERIDWGTTTGTWMDLSTDIATYTHNSTDTNNAMELQLRFTPQSGYEDVRYTLQIKNVDNGQVLAQLTDYTGEGVLSVFERFDTDPSTTDDLKIEYLIITTEDIEYTSSLRSKYINNGIYGTQEDSSTSGTVITNAGIVLDRLLPEMEVTEFIKGLIQMFKLVVVGKEGGDFYVNSLDAYYRQGKRYDISDYVDYAEYNVERGEILNELDFKFQDPSTILATQFLDNNGVGYGDSKVTLKDLDGEAFDGDTLTVELPFETIVYERLTDNNNDTLTAIQVGNVIDIEYSPVFTEPHLHYASKIRINDADNHILYQNTITLDDYIWMPMTHSGVYNPAYSLLFESENSTYTYEELNNTLYSNHYQNYVEAIFNIKRRTTTVKCNLPIQIITQLDLNDIITIDKLDYRINNFKYNLLTGITNLELINGFDKFETNDVILPTECFQASNLAGQYRFNIPNIEDYTITSSVVGGGTAFVTNSVTRNQLILDVAAWTSVPVGTFSRTTELVFTSQNGTPTIVEKITDGSFANGSSDWTVGANNWTIANGKATNDGSAYVGNNSILSQSAVLPRPLQGSQVTMSVNITSSSTGRLIMIAGGETHQFSTGNGVKTHTFTVNGSSETALYSVDGFNGSVTDVSMTVLEGGETIQQGGMCITQTNQGL